MPFGIQVTPGIFQQIIDMLLNDVDIPKDCFDDISI